MSGLPALEVLEEEPMLGPQTGQTRQAKSSGHDPRSCYRSQGERREP